MESVRKLETNLAGWYKQWPHLPKELTKFLSDWAWLFTLIGVVLSAIGVYILVATLFFGAAYLSSGLGGVYGTAISGALTVAVIISLIFSGLVIYLSAMAIMPLKNKKKRGWDLIYYVVLINLVATIVSSVVSYNFFGIVWGIIGAIVSGYFLYEVRGHFLPGSAHTSAPRK